jgi:hypothetical protein
MKSTCVAVLMVIPLLAFVALSQSSHAMVTTADDATMKKEDQAMMKKDDAMMMKKDEAMMKKTDDTMMKKEDSMMKDTGVMSTGSNLSLGSKGTEVVTLQTFLESKGLLVMPSGVAKGYFGPLTKVALITYQTSVDVPSTGYYGPITRGVMSKMMMEKTGDTMMKKDETMMKKDDSAMMKKDEAMMEKKTQ